MARLPCVVIFGQSNEEGMAPWDEVSAADFLRITGVAKPGSFVGFERTIPGFKVWTPRMPRAGTALTATGGTATTLIYVTTPALAANELRNRWVVRTNGASAGIARYCIGNTAALAGTPTTLTFDADWDIAPTIETFDILQGGTQGAGHDWETNPAADFIYEGEFRDLKIKYYDGTTYVYADGYDYCNLHGTPSMTPALHVNLRWAGPMFEILYQMKREIAPNEDLYVVQMPIPYSYISVRIGALLVMQNFDFSWFRSLRCNDWNPASANPAETHARYDLYHLLVEHLLKGLCTAAVAPDELDVHVVFTGVGEAESLLPHTAANAANVMAALRDTMTQEIAAAGLSSLPAGRIPWGICGMETDFYTGGHVVNPLYRALAASDSRMFYTEVDDLEVRGPDPAHFTGAAYITKGQREVDGWRGVLQRDAKLSIYGPTFEALRPVWGVSVGQNAIAITADYDALQARAAAIRLWIGAYLLRDPGADRIPVYVDGSGRQISNQQTDVTSTLLGYAWTTPHTGAGPVEMLSQSIGQVSSKPSRGATASAGKVLGYIYGSGQYRQQFSEADHLFVLPPSSDAIEAANTVTIAHNGSAISRWRVTHVGLGVNDQDILLRGNSFGKAMAGFERLDEGSGLSLRRHTLGQDYRSEIATGNRESYPPAPLGYRVSSDTILTRWVPLEYSPDGRADPGLNRYYGNHGGMRQQPVMWTGAIHGLNVQPNWRGVRRAHRITHVWNSTIGVFSGGYSQSAPLYLLRLFDKAYTWTPAGNLMTDLAWDPGTNHSWEADAGALREYDDTGALVGTFASPLTNGYGALVWRATGTHYGANTDLTVAIYSRVGQQTLTGYPSVLRISNFDSGDPDNGSYPAHDQVNKWCKLSCDHDSHFRGVVLTQAYSYHMVVGSFAEVQAALASLYVMGADHTPDSDITPLPP